jgi:very-short-patch-repair endonuclease/DNA-directed RNA polymerase subunit RPC12/RpoP
MPKPILPADPTNSLGDKYPELAKEFNIERNGITAFEVNAGTNSTTRYWWKCAKEHEWDIAIRSRVLQNNKCPYCSGRKATPENNLLALHPEVAKFFNEEKNGMTTDNVTPGFSKRVYWTCANGHEYLKTVVDNVKAKGYCKACTSLGFKFPELEKYYHGDNLIPFHEISAGANKKVKWTCYEDHTYEQQVVHKTLRNQGCPFCAGRYATPENNLLQAYPKIAKEFDTVKNGIGPDQVTPASNRKMWWNCPKGHSYDVSPNKKTREDLPYGCPYCSGYRIDDTNSFGVLFPELAAEFLTEENGVNPNEAPCGRSETYKWKCAKAGHFYSASISDRTAKGRGCPYCSGRYATTERNLAVLKPEHVKHFHPTKNHPLTPFTVTASSNKKIHWICEVGHEWIVTPNAKMGCGQCSMSYTSKIEQHLKAALTTAGVLVLDTVENHKLKIKWRRNSTMTVDIVGKHHCKNVVVEYDGYYYHSGIMSGDQAGDYKKDAQKTKALLDAGYHVVRIREINFNGTLPLVDIEHPNLLQIQYRYRNTDTAESFKAVVTEIEDWLKLAPAISGEELAVAC